MRRRGSAGEGIFITALDLFSLLLFCFIGLAFLDKHGEHDRQALDLPVVSGPTTPSRSPDRTPVVFVAWNGTPDVEGQRGGRCIVAARFGALESAPEAIEVPCWPGAFDQARQIGYSARLQSSAAAGERAVILCTGSASLESCARLHWIMAEHGFVTAVAVNSVE